MSNGKSKGKDEMYARGETPWAVWDKHGANIQPAAELESRQPNAAAMAYGPIGRAV